MFSKKIIIWSRKELRSSPKENILKYVTIYLVAVAILFVGSANADFTFAERVNLELTIPVLDGAHESIVCFSYDGLEMYIMSDRLGGWGNSDLWVSRRASTDKDWDLPENLGFNVNSSSEDSMASISSDGLTLYFSSNRSGGYGNYDIWMTTRATKEAPWGPAVNVGSNINSSVSDAWPWVSPDGLELYFTSYRFGGYGDGDFYVAGREATSDPWGVAANLGPVVNSVYDETRVSLSPDGLLLLFSESSATTTPRPGGYGRADIWMTTRATPSDPWQTPVNLGASVNGSASDVIPRISPDGSTLYYSEYNKDIGGIWENWQVPLFYEPSCGDTSHPYPIGDLSRDCRADFVDLAILAAHWLEDNNP
jgi:hypothetical protein